MQNEEMRHQAGKVGYAVLVLGFCIWKGMSKHMHAIPADFVEKAAVELRRNGSKRIEIHGNSSANQKCMICEKKGKRKLALDNYRQKC